MVNIKISGDGLSFEIDTTIPKAAQVIAFLGNTSNENGFAQQSADIDRNVGLLGEKKRSINEVLNNSGAKTFPEKIIVFAKYTCDIQGQDHFNPEEIKPLFSKAKIQPPKNFKRDFDIAVSGGYLAEDFNNAGYFYITQSGEELIENNFSNKKSKNNKNSKIPKKIFKSNNIKVDEIDILEKDGIESLAEFLKNKKPGISAKKRITAIAYYFKNKKNIDKFTVGNIEYAYRALSLNKKPANLKQALIDCKNKNQYLNNDEEGNWTITQLGEVFVNNQLPSKNE